jgi:hypothetical protein
MFTEHPGGEQASHAGAENDGMGSTLVIDFHVDAPFD